MLTGSQYFPANPPFNSRRALYVDQNAGPFFTLTQAKLAAQSGDCIVVNAGTYAENDLLKNGVNWFFMPGAIVNFLKGGISANDNVTMVYGIFDDRSSGACTCKIGGHGTFICASQGYLQCHGALVVTNALSNISLHCNEISFSIWQDLSAAMGTRAAICVTNAARVEVVCDRIYDAGWGTVYQPGVLDWAELASNVFWQLGDLHIRTKTIDGAGSYCVWCSQPNGNATTANMYIDCDNTVGLIYIDGGGTVGTPNWRTWWTVRYFQQGINFFDGGKHYINAQKIDLNGNALNFNGSVQVWLTAQKITYSNAGSQQWMSMVTGTGGSPTVYADVLFFEDTNGSFLNGGIVISDTSVLILRAGYMKYLGTSAKPMILHNGGSARISGATIDSSNTNNAANNPVKVAGAGLILDKCVLVAPALADSVTSAAAQTIKAYACKTNKAKNANITVQVDALTVDANVS
jgi:hypothetical protein